MNNNDLIEQLNSLCGDRWAQLPNGKFSIPCPREHNPQSPFSQPNIIYGPVMDFGQCGICGLKTKIEPLLTALEEKSAARHALPEDSSGATESRNDMPKAGKRERKSAAKQDERTQPVEETIELLDRPVALAEVHEAFEKVGAVNRDILGIVMAAAYSSLRTDLVEAPLWVVLVGPPSSLKTELAKALNGLPHIYYLDTLTSNPFASGYVPQKGRKAYDLLDELNDKCLVIRDMTTLFSLNEDTVKKLLGELVAIYDQEFAKFSATRGKQSYKARFSLLGCITPAALNNHRRYINMIGPRFLFVRLPDLTPEREARGFEIAWQPGKRSTLIRNARQLMISYLTQLANAKPPVEPEGMEMREIINGLATLVSRGRGVVITKQQSFKDEGGNEKSYFEVEGVQCEEPWRALLQLRGMGRCLAAIRGRAAATMEETKVLADIALSSMPPDRAEVVAMMFRNPDASLTARDIHGQLPQRSQRTIQRNLKELQALQIVDSFKDKDASLPNAPWQWFLSEKIKGALIKAYGRDAQPMIEGISCDEKGRDGTFLWDEPDIPLDQPANDGDAPHPEFPSQA